MSVRLIVLDKHPDVRPFGVGETLKHLLSKIVIKVTGTESGSAFHDNHLCDILKSLIDGTVHGVQAIWDTKSIMEDW